MELVFSTYFTPNGIPVVPGQTASGSASNGTQGVSTSKDSDGQTGTHLTDIEEGEDSMDSSTSSSIYSNPSTPTVSLKLTSTDTSGLREGGVSELGAAQTQKPQTREDEKQRLSSEKPEIDADPLTKFIKKQRQRNDYPIHRVYPFPKKTEGTKETIVQVPETLALVARDIATIYANILTVKNDLESAERPKDFPNAEQVQKFQNMLNKRLVRRMNKRNPGYVTLFLPWKNEGDLLSAVLKKCQIDTKYFPPRMGTDIAIGKDDVLVRIWKHME